MASKGANPDTLGTFSSAFSFRIDTINPDTSITSATAPSGGSGSSINSGGSTSSNSIRFTFSGSDTGGLHPTTPFECKLDAAPFTSVACSSPKDITGLSAGSHTFQVRAVDAAGNIDSTPASFTWTVDTTEPNTTINTATVPSGGSGTSISSGGSTSSSPIRFTFSGSDNFGLHPTTPFECKLDAAAFTSAACSSPKDITGLSEGSHTFQVRAVDAASNRDSTPASFTWTVDTTAPNTVLDSATDGNNNAVTDGGTTPSNSISFAFSGDPTSDTDHFVCTIDGGAEINPCVSPKQFNSLSSSSHTFTVAAVDAVGNKDQSPISFTWTIQIANTKVDTSMSLQLSGNSKETPGVTFTASGKLINAISGTPIANKQISVTIDGSSPVTATTDTKGMFSIQLTAPATIGNHNIQGHYAGDSQYKSSDSPIRKLKVEGAAPADTSLSLNLGKNKVTAGSSYSASGTLINELTKSPIAGMTISVTTDGSSAKTANTDSKGKFTVQLTAPSTNGNHDIQAHFVGNSQYKSSDSSISKLTVQGSGSSSSLTLKLGKDKVTARSSYSASGTLINAVTKAPISGKTISVTTDGSSPATVTTDKKGKFTTQLTAPRTYGKHDIQAHFAGDSQSKSSDSSISKLTVQGSGSSSTSLSLKLGKGNVNVGSTYSVSGKLVDAVTKAPISGKTIAVTTDGGSPKDSDTTDSKGNFKTSLKAADSPGKHNIQAHFAETHSTNHLIRQQVSLLLKVPP